MKLLTLQFDQNFTLLINNNTKFFYISIKIKIFRIMNHKTILNAKYYVEERMVEHNYHLDLINNKKNNSTIKKLFI